MELTDKKVLVVGLGKSGVAAALFLQQRGARVTASDMSPERELTAVLAPLRQAGIALEIGSHRMQTFLSSDWIIISPGVPHTIEPLAAAQRKGIPVMGELELASRFISEPIIAITGTNGKTTTTELVGAMLRQSGQHVFVGGNIGSPLIGYAGSAPKADHVVVEVSSFQLDTIETFRPQISLLLNISPDHLDRYPDYEAYARSKARIFMNQRAQDTAILNGSDPGSRRAGEGISAQKLFFTGCSEHEQGAVMGPQQLRFRLTSGAVPAAGIPPGGRIDWPRGRDSLLCSHVRENMSAACLAALVAGADLVHIQRVIDTYTGQAHRMEYIGRIKDVSYYNDSKATNVDAVQRALACLEVPIVLIMGGRNKKIEFKELTDTVRRKVKSLILMGEAAEDIAGSLGHLTSTRRVGSMAEAVAEAHAAAAPGEAVLFSPACASFDMYRNYQERGEDFREEVHRLRQRVMP